jgi:hypothetical protein
MHNYSQNFNTEVGQIIFVLGKTITPKKADTLLNYSAYSLTVCNLVLNAYSCNPHQIAHATIPPLLVLPAAQPLLCAGNEQLALLKNLNILQPVYDTGKDEWNF